MTELQRINNTLPWDWPETAATLFLVTLQDSAADKADRLLAAEMDFFLDVLKKDKTEKQYSETTYRAYQLPSLWLCIALMREQAWTQH